MNKANQKSNPQINKILLEKPKPGNSVVMSKTKNKYTHKVWSRTKVSKKRKLLNKKPLIYNHVLACWNVASKLRGTAVCTLCNMYP